MKTLDFNISIKASPAKVWQVLWNDLTYRKWTAVFHEGSHAVSDWKEGGKILFLGPDGGGMYSTIAESRPHEYMAFKHLGEVKNFEEQPNDEKSASWSGSMETYTLKENNGTTDLLVSVDIVEVDDFVKYFKEAFPKALAITKELAEKPLMLTIEAEIKAPVEKVWEFWTSPDHITKWNNAVEDWHTPYAENDLQTGGKFLFRMAAKDGSVSFDFVGTYDEVKTHEIIAYTMGDSRTAKINFTADGNTTKVVEIFEAETENILELQQTGWQSILNNFKKYAEANSQQLNG